MSATQVIRYLLAHDADVLAVVAAADIKAGGLPLNTALPAIAVNEVSSVERTAIALAPADQLATARVQVTVMTKTYPQQKSLLELVRLACANRRGTVDGVYVDAIVSDGAGPEFKDDAATIYTQSRDFLVRFTAPS